VGHAHERDDERNCNYPHQPGAPHDSTVSAHTNWPGAILPPTRATRTHARQQCDIDVASSPNLLLTLLRLVLTCGRPRADMAQNGSYLTWRAGSAMPAANNYPFSRRQRELSTGQQRRAVSSAVGYSKISTKHHRLKVALTTTICNCCVRLYVYRRFTKITMMTNTY